MSLPPICRGRILRFVLKCLSLLLVVLFLVLLNREKFPDYDYKEGEKVVVPEFTPWYFGGGLLRPAPSRDPPRLWPEEEEGDRIVNQLMFAPREEPRVKKRVYVEDLRLAKREKWPENFDECPVSQCEFVRDASTADAVIFENFITRTRDVSSADQVWILHTLESPLFAGKVIQQSSVNWTASYRLDSDLVTPYDKWAYYDEDIRAEEPERNYAKGKTKKVAWFVSNCHSKNKRLEYARALQKFIPVDIYGACGENVCPKVVEDSCREMVSENYKFYLSFENANCRDYITEKFYLNALRLGVVPVVMGAPREDYEKVAPHNSFIHVEDFESPKHLAEYLHFLDRNDKAYNSYFAWRSAGEFINTRFTCRLCAMLHSGGGRRFYKKFGTWWRSPRTCIKNFWNKAYEERILASLKRKITP